MGQDDMLISPGLVWIGLKAQSKEQVLEVLSGLLLRDGFVKPSFSQAVIDREREYPTGLPTTIGVAIPHADPEHVVRPGAALATLAHPVRFGVMGDANATVQVELVLMLALHDADSQVSVLQRLVEAFQVPGLLAELKNQQDPTAAAHLLGSYLAG